MNAFLVYFVHKEMGNLRDQEAPMLKKRRNLDPQMKKSSRKITRTKKESSVEKITSTKEESSDNG